MPADPILESERSGVAQANNLKSDGSLFDHADRRRRAPSEVEIATPDEGTSIVNAHDH